MSERLDRYFAQEAGDYLDQLDALLAVPGPGDAAELLRLWRGVRGSAGMAGAGGVAALAERVEETMRGVVAGRLYWGEPGRQLARRTVDDLRHMLRATGPRGQLDDMRVHAALQRWDALEAGGGLARPEPVRPLDDDELAAAAPFGGDLGGPVVPIESLFYDDDAMPPASGAALWRALALRPAIESAAAALPSSSGIVPLLGELFDLLEAAARE